MGQKVNPIGMRVGVNKGWTSQWVADKNSFKKFIKEDNDIRKFIKGKYGARCAISKIVIERAADKTVINIHTGAPGMLIGQKGAGIEGLKKEVIKMLNRDVVVNVVEVKSVDTDATLVAESIAQQLEKRVSWRRAMKQAMQRAQKAGAKGIKTMIGGRLDGAEIARSEHYQEGSLPLHTLRSNIDYGVATARTTAGAIGVKVWIYHGEILGDFATVSRQTRQTAVNKGGDAHVNAKKS